MGASAHGARGTSCPHGAGKHPGSATATVTISSPCTTGSCHAPARPRDGPKLVGRTAPPAPGRRDSPPTSSPTLPEGVCLHEAPCHGERGGSRAGNEQSHRAACVLGALVAEEPSQCGPRGPECRDAAGHIPASHLSPMRSPDASARGEAILSKAVTQPAWLSPCVTLGAGSHGICYRRGRFPPARPPWATSPAPADRRCSGHPLPRWHMVTELHYRDRAAPEQSRAQKSSDSEPHLTATLKAGRACCTQGAGHGLAAAELPCRTAHGDTAPACPSAPRPGKQKPPRVLPQQQPPGSSRRSPGGP